MIKANDIKRNSWIPYDKNSDFPIQNIPFGVFKLKTNNTIHCGTIIGETIISLTKLEELGYFKNSLLKKGTFQSNNLNLFLAQNKKIWRTIRDLIAELFDLNNPQLKSHENHRKLSLFRLSEIESIIPVDIGDYTDIYRNRYW